MLFLSVFSCMPHLYAADALRGDETAVRVQARNRHVHQGVEYVSDSAVFDAGGRFVWQRLALDTAWLTDSGSSYTESLLGTAYVLDMPDLGRGPILYQAGVRRRGYPGVWEQKSRWEIWGQMDWQAARHLHVSIEAYNGLSGSSTGFGEIGLHFPFELHAMPGGVVTPRVLLGLDHGDVSGRRRLRENHVEYALQIAVPLASPFAAVGEVSHSAGSGRDEDGNKLGAHTWVTFGAVMRF
jgi:hypothetical protein